MAHEQHPKPLVETVREHIAAIFSAYTAATGTPPSVASKLVCGDPKFPKSYLKFNISVGTYDRFVSRFSACWPEWADWPAAVPRQAPAQIEADELEAIRARQQRVAPPPVPGQWPADIPQPNGA